MDKVKMAFSTGGRQYRPGDDAPEDRYAAERRERGLTYSTKTINPETKDDLPKPKRRPRKRKSADAAQ